MKLTVGMLLLAGLTACGGGGGRYSDDTAYYDDIKAEAEAEAMAEYDAEQAAADAAEEAEASDVGEFDVEPVIHTGCISDCGGHEAGEAWARENDISDQYDCGGNSRSFIEGCQAFVAARQELAEEEARDTARSEAEDMELYEPEYEEDVDVRRGY